MTWGIRYAVTVTPGEQVPAQPPALVLPQPGRAVVVGGPCGHARGSLPGVGGSFGPSSSTAASREPLGFSLSSMGKARSSSRERSGATPSGEVYEAELFRLQAELVKVQEWVRAEGQRIVVVFEGRDAAGKGGTIKRITQYLNPRVARDRRAARADRAGARRSGTSSATSSTCPRAGEIVLFDRSWYNRAGVERVMGFCTPARVPPVPAPVPDLRAAARRGRHPAAQVLVLGQRRGAGAPVQVPARTTRCGSGSCRRWTWSRSPAGRTTPGPRTR